MLMLEPVVDLRLCQVFVVQTFTRWHGGVAREYYADEWLQATGPLGADEAEAIAVLRAALLEGGGGCGLIRRLRGADPSVADPVRQAVRVLAPRAQRIVQEAEASLRGWQAYLAEGPLPEWYACMCGSLGRFFGAEGADPLRVYVLPSAPGGVSGNGDMFLESGATNVDCSGQPLDRPDEVLMTVLHEGVHSVYQPRVLGPLVRASLATAEGRRVDALRHGSPVPFDMDSYVGELVAGALEGGVLREHCGLTSQAGHWDGVVERGSRVLQDPSFDGWDYDAWVGLGAAAMIPVVARYVDGGRVADADLVGAAMGAFEATYRLWRAAHDPDRPDVLGPGR